MDLNPSTCWDCPASLLETSGWALLALALVVVASLCRAHRYKLIRLLGALLFVTSGIFALLLSAGIFRFGVIWPGTSEQDFSFYVSPIPRILNFALVATFVGLFATLPILMRKLLARRNPSDSISSLPPQ